MTKFLGCLGISLLLVIFSDQSSAANKGNALPTVGIMGIDLMEIGDVVQNIESPVITDQGMHKAYSGRLWGFNTVLITSNVGKVASASAVVDLIVTHKVDLIIFMGTTAALDKRLNIGDIVISSSLVDLDVDFSPFYPTYEVPLSGKQEFLSNHTMSQLAKAAANQFLQKGLQIPETTLVAMHIESPVVCEGMIGTTDSFLLSNRSAAAIKASLPQLLCIEMEGVSVIRLANEYNIPAVVIRTVSNYIDNPESKEPLRVSLDYMKFVEEVQGSYSPSILKNFYSIFHDYCELQGSQ